MTKAGGAMKIVGRALDEKGLSMVELLISMLILTVVSLALFNTAMVSIAANTRNGIRDEAVRLAEARMDGMRNADYEDLASHAGLTNTTLPVRMTNVRYDIENTVELLTKCTRLSVGISWQWQGETYTHAITTLRGEP